MTDVAADPHMAANAIFDILNEPDSQGLTWGPNGNQIGGKGLGYWYHQIMSIGYGINPSASLSSSVAAVLFQVLRDQGFRSQGFTALGYISNASHIGAHM